MRSLLKTAILLSRRSVEEFFDDNCTQMAAAISYYFLFSIIPLTIFTVSIFGLIVRDEDLQQDLAEEIVNFMSVEEGVPLLTADEEAIDRNYAAHLPVLDMMFGSYLGYHERWPEDYGVVGKPLPTGFLAQHLYPFIARSKP